MLTIREAQNRTRLSDAAIRRHIKSGRIQATQTSDGRYLIEEPELTKLPKPRNTGTHQAMDEREVPQGVPFLDRGTVLKEAIKLIQQIEINRQKDQVFIQNLIASQL